MSVDAPVLESVIASPESDESLLAPVEIDYEQFVTEDDAPVDNLFSEREQRLLAESLYVSWKGPGGGRPFLAMTNVGLFFALTEPPYAPDVLVSLDVRPPDNPFPKKNRSYFVWEYGKPPDIVVEIVSNRKGGELSDKLAGYVRIGTPYYIVHDPEHLLSDRTLYVFERRGLEYAEISPENLPGIGLGVTLWDGVYEDMQGMWLRWIDTRGELLLTGKERAEQERQRADALAAKLRELGIDPNQVIVGD
ncbi:MAG: Uma2 family endonuclease [Caldilinea sp.]|jgi:Uma2 family endonuclease|nr:Uma2 family endonuclease [Caldilinea sp.]